MSDHLPKIAVIGTGGTISSVGRHKLELTRYIDHGTIYSVTELLEQVPEINEVADIVSVPYANLASPAIGPKEWIDLANTVSRLPHQYPDLDGIVITHGTATLEETAYFLNLTIKTELPVVVVGAQRPASGLSTDAFLNLVNAARAAGDPSLKGCGVVVMLNDEIQAAREVTKTSTLRLQTFRTPDFGVLGHIDEDRVAMYRYPLRRSAPGTEFDVTALESLPRVDVVTAYGGMDGIMVDAALNAGARGIIAAGFAPGLNSPELNEALEHASQAGVIVVQSSRVGSGRVPKLNAMQVKDGLVADNLTPQKARILLMLALTVTNDRPAIQRIFDTY